MPLARLVLLLLLMPVITMAQPVSWKNFTDTAGNFSAKYPSTWAVKIKAGNRVFFSSPAGGAKDEFVENINISVSTGPNFENAKIKDLISEAVVNVSKEFTEYKQENLRYFKWNSMDAGELIFSGLNKGQTDFKIRVTQWYCYYNSRLYVVTFVAKETTHTHDETARSIMNAIIFN